MTRHTRYAVTYGAVVALASALVAPSAAFAAPDATGGEVTPAAQQRPQAATQQANNTDTDQQTVTTDDGASLSGVKVAQVGQEIVVSGSGWKDKNGGGSVAAVKLDGGAVVPRGQVSYGGKEYGSRGVVAVVEADDAGNFVARIPFPSADNSNVKDSDWGVGSKHTVTFLSGSLKVDGGGKKVDVVRSAELEVTVGDTKAEPQQTPAPQQPAATEQQQPQQPKARPQTPQSDNQTRQPSKDNDQAQVQPQQPADENDTSNWVKLDAPATGQGSAGVMYVKPYTTGKGSKLRIKGSGWTNAEGKGGSTVALKLNYLKDGKSAQYSRAGGHGAIDQYLQDNGKSADSTTWALLIPDAGKANPAQGLYALNPDGTFDIEIDVPEQLQTGKTGDYLSITAQSGRNAPNDTQRAATSKTIPVNGQAAAEYKEPENTDVCSPEGGDFSPKLKIENPTVEPGGKLHITGSGWCNPDDKRVSKIGLKIDDGSVSHNDATKVNSNLTIWAIVEPDAKTGNIDTYIDLPTAENTGLSGEALKNVTSGEHTLRLLTGSLRKGDRHGTYGGPEGDNGVNTKFVIGDYKPGADPASVPASQLGEGDRHGVSVEHNGKQLTVKVPEAEPGTWVKVTPYLGDSAQLARASKWVQLDQNRTVSYTMSGELPAADYRIVVQSGNQGENGKVLGWAPLHVAEAADNGGTSGRGSVSPADQSSYDSAEPEVTIDEDGQAWDSSGNAVSVSTAPAPYQNAGVGYVSSSIGTSPASIAPFTSGTRSVVVANAKSKAASARKATSANGKSKSTGPVKNAAKKTVQAKAANDNNGNDTASQGGSPQAKVEHRVNGTELTGFAKWFANNANNLLMSLAGIVLLALALTFKKKNSD
ncbi:Cyclin D1-binding domain-containing protein [Rothia aeria]|uniref:Cyclin D1-binding domain-containing protein n=1 Tax=Rothia aeria TaxID=172042 RepID=UPI00068EF34B|nr:Cyclin D1-binding domain-containing protein [Rothia aeria]